MCNILSIDVQDIIYVICEIDAHLIWEILEDLYGSLKYIDQEQVENKSPEVCLTSETRTDPQMTSLKNLVAGLVWFFK